MMSRFGRLRLSHIATTLGAAVAFGAIGCQSPYYADRGALTGGLAGAGVGALVGNALGETGGGALVGAGVGALTGAAVGSALDDIEARNRAEIAARLGRPVSEGAATVPDVVAMTRAGVDPQLIVNHVQSAGMAQSVGPQDVIYLTQQGVPPTVIEAMQRPRVASAPAPIVPVGPPPPVIVEEVHFGGPYYCPPPRHYFRHHHHGHGPRVGWGISFSG